MQTNRSKRALAGAVSLIAVALVMGWFAGRYIPGTPKAPEAPFGDGLYSKTGYSADEIVDLAPGSTLKLRDVTLGVAYAGRPDEIALHIPSESEEGWREQGLWEYDAPAFDLTVREIKVITTASFADWYPEYAGLNNPVYDSSKLVAVSAVLVNASNEPVELREDFPAHNFTLWGENLDYIDQSLGAGAVLDGAYYFANEFFRFGQQTTLEPGESVEITLPFKVNRNSLKDPGVFDDLDPSDFCLQLIDYRPCTAYRLWL